MIMVYRVIINLCPEDFHAEVQVMISLISYDEETLPEALAGLAASAAISITDIPFNGPMSEVRVVRVNGELIVNPGNSQLEGVDLDLVVGGTKSSIVMVEGEIDRKSVV